MQFSFKVQDLITLRAAKFCFQSTNPPSFIKSNDKERKQMNNFPENLRGILVLEKRLQRLLCVTKLMVSPYCISYYGDQKCLPVKNHSKYTQILINKFRVDIFVKTRLQRLFQNYYNALSNSSDSFLAIDT